MPRLSRVCPAGTCFHVLNRAVARLPIFEKPEGYQAFERVLAEAYEREKLLIYAHHHSEEKGHLYQGRFKAFPIEEEDCLLRALRYIERNSLRANLCNCAEDWRWCSVSLANRSSPTMARSRQPASEPE